MTTVCDFFTFSTTPSEIFHDYQTKLVRFKYSFKKYTQRNYTYNDDNTTWA